MSRDTVVSETIKMIRDKFSYLFDDYGFKIAYFTKDYGYHWYGTAVGLSSESSNYILMFAREVWAYPIRIDIAPKGTNFASYASSKWEYLPHIIYLLSGERVKCIERNPAKDLEAQCKYLKPYMDKINTLYETPEHFNKWLEIQEEARKGENITIEQIKAERVRLKALGLDSSLKTAMENLRGKQNE